MSSAICHNGRWQHCRAHQPVLGVPQPLLQLVDHVAGVAARLPAVHCMFQRCGSTTMHVLEACKKREAHAAADGHLCSEHRHTQLALQCSLRTCFSFGTTENLAVVALMMAMSTACRGTKHIASAPQIATCLNCQQLMASVTLALLCACSLRLSEGFLYGVCCVPRSRNILECSVDLSLSTRRMPTTDPQARCLPSTCWVQLSSNCCLHKHFTAPLRSRQWLVLERC